MNRLGLNYRELTPFCSTFKRDELSCALLNCSRVLLLIGLDPASHLCGFNKIYLRLKVREYYRGIPFSEGKISDWAWMIDPCTNSTYQDHFVNCNGTALSLVSLSASWNLNEMHRLKKREQESFSISSLTYHAIKCPFPWWKVHWDKPRQTRFISGGNLKVNNSIQRKKRANEGTNWHLNQRRKRQAFSEKRGENTNHTMRVLGLSSSLYWPFWCNRLDEGTRNRFEK